LDEFVRSPRTGAPDGPHPNSPESGLWRAFATQSLASFAPSGRSFSRPENAKRSCARSARGVNSRRSPAPCDDPPLFRSREAASLVVPSGQGAGRERRLGIQDVYPYPRPYAPRTRAVDVSSHGPRFRSLSRSLGAALADDARTRHRGGSSERPRGYPTNPGARSQRGRRLNPHTPQTGCRPPSSPGWPDGSFA
jgi:hypothetical protein